MRVVRASRGAVQEGRGMSVNGPSGAVYRQNGHSASRRHAPAQRRKSLREALQSTACYAPVIRCPASNHTASGEHMDNVPASRVRNALPRSVHAIVYAFVCCASAPCRVSTATECITLARGGAWCGSNVRRARVCILRRRTHTAMRQRERNEPSFVGCNINARPVLRCCA